MTKPAIDFAKIIQGSGTTDLDPILRLKGYHSGTLEVRIDNVKEPNFVEVHLQGYDGFSPLLNRRQINQLVEWLELAAVYITDGPEDTP